ncbi:centromere protein U [Perognathus longimembris pacificus]|uniref:centromere protein U n=1 Tax=Perognathus longimembris pacificus TaxID=214514 RepID=UPI0020185389|nr:centromere protein U [Perognathus longimembris pacificus]
MAPRRRRRSLGRAGTENPKNTAGRTHFLKDKATQEHRPIDIFDFPENSVISRNDKDEEAYENFDPPLHSTAIYTDDEFGHCASSVPLTPQSSSTTENEASGSKSVRVSVRKSTRKLAPISDDSESTEDVRRKVKSVEKIRPDYHDTTPPVQSSEPSENSAEAVIPKRTEPLSTQAKAVTPESTKPLSTQASINKKTPAKTQRQLKTPRKRTVVPGKRKKPRNEATDSDVSESMHIWCLEGRKSSDIMELDIVLSEFEKIFLQYQQRIESTVYKEAVTKFYLNIKEELIRMLKEVQMLKTLKRKNAKVITDIERKRQRLIEVQDELLRLQPQLKQLQTKHDELKERKSSLGKVMCFISNLKQLYQDYSDVQEKEPNIQETYDSSSLPALLFKAKTILAAENHLKNINQQLETLLDQNGTASD